VLGFPISPTWHDHGQGVHVEGVDLKASAMTIRSRNAVRRLVALRRLAQGLRGVGLSAAWLAGVGAAGAVVSMRKAYPRTPQAAPAQGWLPATPVPEGRLAVAMVLGANPMRMHCG
jgi:hypothetical protein